MAQTSEKVISIREEVKPSLDDKIADAFGKELSSDALQVLLLEVGQALESVEEIRNEASERALDPKTRPADVEAARRDMDDAVFRSQRLAKAKEQLSALQKSAVEREAREQREAAHAEAVAERNTLVEDLAAYEQHAKAITALLHRIYASNAKLSMDGHAERIARGFELMWNVQPDDSRPQLVSMVRLPKFRADGTNYGYLWPPSLR